MAHGTVVLVGNLSIEPLVLDRLMAEFGFLFQHAESLQDLKNLNLHEDLLAVLFSPSHLGLRSDEALRAVLDAAPRTLPILCHGFSDHIDLADAGVFHSLLLPFNLAEVRQSLGFVWGTRRPTKPMPPGSDTEERASPGRVRAARIVA
jgi:hypothetical protein